MKISNEQVLAALRNVEDPDLKKRSGDIEHD